MKLPEMRVESKSLNVVINASADSVGPLREDESVDFFCDADPCKIVKLLRNSSLSLEKMKQR